MICVLLWVFTTRCSLLQGNAESNNLDTGAGSMEAICKFLFCSFPAARCHDGVLEIIAVVQISATPKAGATAQDLGPGSWRI